MPERVLVVEDNALNRELVRDVLELAGYEVLEAASVPEARARLAAARVAAVILDIQIPGGGGELLLREIRARPELGSTPVIAVTALAMQGDRERLLAAGLDSYISKPIDTRSFATTVRAEIARGRGLR
jgi:CheY-like chemotaxis protein